MLHVYDGGDAAGRRPVGLFALATPCVDVVGEADVIDHSERVVCVEGFGTPSCSARFGLRLYSHSTSSELGPALTFCRCPQIPDTDGPVSRSSREQVWAWHARIGEVDGEGVAQTRSSNDRGCKSGWKPAARLLGLCGSYAICLMVPVCPTSRERGVFVSTSVMTTLWSPEPVAW